MRRRINLAVIALISCVSVFNIGFSGWVIVNHELQAFVGGSISAERVVIESEFVVFELGEIPVYTAQGFLEQKQNAVRYSMAYDMEVRCKVDKQRCIDVYGKEYRFPIRISMSVETENAENAEDFVRRQDFLTATVNEEPQGSAREDSFDIVIEVSSEDTESLTIVYRLDFKTFENYTKYFFLPFRDHQAYFQFVSTTL